MKIISDNVYLSLLPDNKVAISFTMENRYLANKLVESFKGEKVEVNVKKFANLRSLRQNDFLWAIISKVSDHTNGERTQESLDKIYGDILTEANIKRDLVAILPEAAEMLKATFRAVIPTGQQIESINEKTGKKATLITAWVYHGSSKLNTKEMGELLDYALHYALKSGVDTIELDAIRREYE